MRPQRRRRHQGVLTLFFALFAISCLATTAAMGARTPRPQATAKKKPVEGPRPGRYKGKTTAGTPTPTDVNQVAIAVQRSRSRHRLELTAISFYQVATCQDGSHMVLSLTGFLLQPPLIAAHLNHPLSLTYPDYSYGVKSPTGSVHFVLNFRSTKDVTGVLSATRKFPSGGQVCATGTRPFEAHRWAGVPSVP